ncbi:MAG: GNAT family N-acetyltransferase [Lentisphaeria bacterium]|nr:GNAT family N-acetyltransferase [Candidatus Neomarinimicrobiota bacterium]MCF7842816.1 GNAT family N-acetyltransferase [Lentisphaeria bacterium]
MGESQLSHPFERMDIAPGIHLDCIRHQYAQDIFKLIDTNRQHLQPWLPWVDISLTVEDTQAFIERMDAAREKETVVCTVIFVENEIAGLVDLHAIDTTNKHASIGYWLGKQYEGLGIMTRAVEALIRYGFMKLQLERIEICVVPDNTRSRAIPERLGFTLEGTLRHYQRHNKNQYRDLMVYSLLSGEYAMKPNN